MFVLANNYNGGESDFGANATIVCGQWLDAVVISQE